MSNNIGNKSLNRLQSLSLNIEQRAAVTADLKPLLIVAGAGTGKTRTLISRLIYLLENNLADKDGIITLAFTNKAADEIKNRTNIKNTDLFRGPFVGTFHSLGAKILRQEANLVGRNRLFVILDDDDSLSLVKKIIKNLNIGKKIFAGEILNQISRVKSNLIDFKSAGFKDQSIFEQIFESYENYLLKNNAFDFDDLIIKPIEIFQNYPKILLKYQNKISHILIDEYQDINEAQYRLIRLLDGKRGRISAVGDDEQAIYSFRGANYRFFLNFQNDWSQSLIFNLEENYRSSANIIEAASAVIANNRYRAPKNLWTRNERGKLVKIIQAIGEENEANLIVQNIKQSLESGMKNIAVLYRTNAYSRAIEEALIRNNIPYFIVGGVRFYARKEIKDIICALRLALNNNDSLSAERLEKLLGKRKFKDFMSKWPPKYQLATDLIAKFLEMTNYFDYLKNNYSNYLEREENIAELIRFSESKKLDDFLEKVSLAEPADKTDSKSIKLMTIHLAKGLEFEKVFLAGASEGILPHTLSASELGIEEERRLMYVAMTRAKKELVISYFGLPSRFLGEIPPNVAEFEIVQLSDEDDFISYL